MKKVVILIATILFSFILEGQNAFPIVFMRQKLMSKLTFVYVDKPHLPKSNSTASDILSNDDIANNRNLTGDFWTNANNRGSQNLVKKLLQPPQSREDSLLQYIVGTVLLIQNKKVKVYLFNDWNNTSLSTYHSSWGIDSGLYGDSTLLNSSSSSPWVWPHAMHRVQGEFTGYISMGSAFLSDYVAGHDASMSTIIHELVHTQDNAESTRIFNSIAYGRNQSHTYKELLSNFYVAYTEGIANAFEMRYNTGPHPNLFNELNNNGHMVYEVQPSTTCSIIPQNCCIDKYLLNSHNTSADTTRTVSSGSSSYPVYFYKIRDLPSDVLIHNETVQNYIFYSFINYFSVHELASILRASKARTQDRYGFPIILEEMVKASIDRSISRGQINNSRYFPIAILDYFTGFKLSSKDILNKCLRTKNSDNWSNDISGYWNTKERGWVINKYQNSNQFTPGLLDEIATHFHIRQ